MIEVKERKKCGYKEEYPKLMISKTDSYVVFFHKPKCGIVIKSSKDVYLGVYSVDWVMDGFEDYYGELKIKNK